MARFSASTTEQQPKPTAGLPGKPTQADRIAHLLNRVIRPYLNHHETLPGCAPNDPQTMARWWLERMQESERRHECELASVNHGGKQGSDESGQRWDDRYQNRVTQALTHWLAIPEEQRRIVVNLVQDSGIPYRGEDFERFMAIVDQTETMRELGVVEYRNMAAKQAKALFGSR